MSFRAFGNVWNRSKKRGTHLLVLLAIADWENDDQGGVAYPAIPTLAKKTRLSERQLQRILRDLERSGELRVTPRAGRNGTNLYKTHLPTEIASKGESPVTGDACGPAPVSSGAPKGDTGATQSVKEPLYNSTPIVPEGDIRFWIQICFKCFGQSPRDLARRQLAAIARVATSLDKKQAPLLVSFYRLDRIGSKEPLLSSRKHSPEKLLLHLPEQLALAVRYESEFEYLVP